MSRAKVFAELASQDVTVAEFDQLDTTAGVAGVGTFLRGDKQWAAVGSSSVLQTHSDVDTGSHRTTTNQTAWTTDIGGLSVTITDTQLNSNFLISLHSGMAMDSGDSGRLQVDIKRVITGGATTSGIVGDAANGSDNYGLIHTRFSSVWCSVSGFYLDIQSLAADSTITYSLVFRSGGGGAIYWLHSSSVATLMVQEIAA